MDSIVNYLIPKDIKGDERSKSLEKLNEIMEKFGPIVEGYPSWHPLIAHQDNRFPVTSPSGCYRGLLDHTVLLKNAFITCPYSKDAADRIIEFVKNLPPTFDAKIMAEKLDVTLYAETAYPVLIYCTWHGDDEIDDEDCFQDGFIPASIALSLMLEQELPCRRWSCYGETWETMRPYLLGPSIDSKKLSSSFVSKETILIMRRVWNEIIKAEVFGPPKN
ncbi:TPA: hypothetical protein ACX6PV_000746 [Photobacterium damselae]